MQGSQGILEKLSMLGIHMLPRGGSLLGGALGGPAGAALGGIGGSGLEQLFGPSRSPYSQGLPIGQGMPLQAPQEDDRLSNILGALSGSALSQGTLGLGNALGDGSMPGMGNEWQSLFSKLIQTVPKEEIIRFLEQRGQIQPGGM